MTATLGVDGQTAWVPDSAILVIDDHELFSTALVIALCSRGLNATVVDIGRITDLLQPRSFEAAGLIVLDLDLGTDENGNRVNGADLVEGLRRCGWIVLVVSASRDSTAIAAAIAAGAAGAVAKASTFDDLIRTVRSLLCGHEIMAEAERQELLRCHRHNVQQEANFTRRLARLSPREHEVLGLLADGQRAASIAEYFVVSMPTVRTQIRSILMKLQVGSQLEAVALLLRFPSRSPLSGQS